MPEARVIEVARAKINLALHVLGRRADGYHALDSIVAFADIGDRLTLSPSAGSNRGVRYLGPFGQALSDLRGNIILDAEQALRSTVAVAFPATHFDLERICRSLRALAADRLMPPLPCAVWSSCMTSHARPPHCRQWRRRSAPMCRYVSCPAPAVCAAQART